jgi:hypothetical protein
VETELLIFMQELKSTVGITILMLLVFLLELMTFGTDFLKKPVVTEESTLFDHSRPELAVLNAKERAKAKKLPLSLAEDEENEQTEVTVQGKKAVRKLPKFMLREEPTTAEGVCAENFRTLVKWILTAIEQNSRLTELAKPEFVCVNMPAELNFVLDHANADQDEKSIKFTALEYSPEDECARADLELFGALFGKTLGASNKF